ncbi:MAG TPA: GGDEF domain-containing protein [Phycisphaerae bacterium]|nr:GGDEF domain-containing protein [Phycisphaerae bacterium]
MAILPGTTSSRVEMRREPAQPIVLLAGPDAASLREPLERQFTATIAAEIVTAESILEAVLICGGRSSDDETEDRSAQVALILAGISQELDQIEAAVRSLRKVYPHARILLVCEPEDEVVCRKARNWGATDYLILPVSSAELERLCVLTPLPPKAANPVPAPTNRMAEVTPEEPTTPKASPSSPPPSPVHAPAELLRKVVEMQANGDPASQKLPIRAAIMKARQNGHESPHAHPSETSLPGLPLMVQTALLTDMLNGRPDFPDRIVATLQSYVAWGGDLRFIPANAEQKPETDPNHLEHPVGLPEQTPFGNLVLEPKAPELPWPPAGAVAALSQAAHWMAAILSISRRYEQLRSLAITDELSGAYNRRYFNKFMNGLLERARSNRFRVTLLLFDIDDFKKYNDTFGHASGDAIIRELIKLLRLCTRPDDLVARLGGDEFAVVYWDHEAPRQPNSEHPKDVLKATERFRKAIKNHPWPEICKIKGEVSISGGLATFPWDADTLESLMARADQALLRAKAAGKNAILLHGADCPPGEEKPSETNTAGQS